MKFIILSILCAVGIAAGYEFDDPLYNQLLLQDLIDASDYEASSLRVRRQSGGAESTSPATTSSPPSKHCHGPGGHGPEGWKDKMCCEDKLFNETFHEEMHAIKMECFEETRKANGEENAPPPDAFHCGGMGRAKREFACVMLCVAKKQNTINNNGEIMIAEAVTLLRTKALAPEWAKEKAEEIVEKCAVEARKMDESPKSNEIDDDEKMPKCKKTALKFGHCIFRELSLDCPADKQKDSKMCKIMREKGFKHGPGRRGGSSKESMKN